MKKEARKIYHVGVYCRYSSIAVQQVIYVHAQLLSNVHEVHTVCFHADWQEDSYSEKEEESVLMHEFGRTKAYGVVLPGKFKSWVKTLSARSSVFHLHATFSPVNYALMKILRRNSIPYVFTPHNPYKGHVLKRRRVAKQLYVSLFERQVIRNAATVHALSGREVDTLMQLGARKVVVVPNTIDAPDDKRIYSRNKCDVPSVCFVGRLEPLQKGIDWMLEAIKILRKVHNVPVRFTLIGPGKDSEIDFIKRKCADFGLVIDESVIFAGQLFGEDKYNMLRRSKIYLQLSRWEGLGLSVLEALSVGTPVVISTHVPIDNGGSDRNGIYIVRSATEAAQVMKNIFDLEEEKYIEVCKDSKNIYQAYYSDDVVRQKLVNMYEQIT